MVGKMFPRSFAFAVGAAGFLACIINLTVLGADGSDALPGIAIGLDVADSLRAGQSGKFDCTVPAGAKACTATNNVPCPVDPGPPTCTQAAGGSPCGTCNGNKPKTCVSGTTLAACTTKTISCCSVNGTCQTQGNGCNCVQGANANGIGTNTTCP